MNKYKNILLILLGLIGILLTILLISKNLISYAIISGALGVVFIIMFFIGIFSSKSPEDIYNSYIRDIMKTFDAILVNTDELPEVNGRNVVMVPDFEDLVDAQIEIRKPIFYKRADRSAIFVLLDDKEACITLLKVNNNEKSPFQGYIDSQKKKKDIFDKNILEDIENTTIVKLDNNKSYKISPINNNKKQSIKDRVDLHNTLEGLPKLRDTMNLDKTTLFKDINKR